MSEDTGIQATTNDSRAQINRYALTGVVQRFILKFTAEEKKECRRVFFVLFD